MAGNNPKSPRQKMINLMYIVLTAMLALNVSSDVLNGFTLVEESLKRSIKNARTQNDALYGELSEYYQKNETKAEEWYNKGKEVHLTADSLVNYIQDLKVRIVKVADGKDGDVDNVDHVDDLEASNQVMLAPGKGIKEGKKLRLQLDKFRTMMLSMVADSVKRKIIDDNLSTKPSARSKADNKNWEQALFENMPVAAAMTILSKLQSDILYAEGEVLHTLVNNIDVGDFRVNQINAYVIPNSRYVIRGGKYSAQIILAAEDSTQRPLIYVGNNKLDSEKGGLYEATATSTGTHTINGYLEVLRGDNEVLRRNFTDTYTVVEPSATVSATLMNVLYAAYENPISISVPGVPTSAISATSNGNGTLTPKGNGQWVAKPSKVGQDFVINVTAQMDGRSQVVANSIFKVRQLPDPTPFIEYKDENGNTRRYKGGTGFSKAALMAADGIMAAIDDGLLNINFRVVRFETVFFDSMGNAMLELSNGSNFTERQKDQFRRLTRGKRFYISRVTAIGPDGVERLISPIEVIVN